MAEIVNGVGINEANAHVKKSRSRFPLEEPFFDTHRFGEYHPNFVIDGIAGDVHHFRSVHDTRSYTLKAPLMQDVIMNKDYFMVTLRSILPFQSERVVTNPNLGDDVPADAYTCVTDFITKFISFVNGYVAIAGEETADFGARPSVFSTFNLKSFILLESVFSRGSLLASLGCSLSRCLRIHKPSGGLVNIDKVIDGIGSEIRSYVADNELTVSIDGVEYVVVNDTSFELDDLQLMKISVRRFFEMIRDTSNWFFVAPASGTMPYFGMDYFVDTANHFVLSSKNVPIDLCRLWAYHLVCAEYYSNDKVDYIYSADLFRQYIYNLYTLWAEAKTLPTSNLVFDWNGSKLSYDYLSSHFFDILASVNVHYEYTDTGFSPCIPVEQYFLTLFGYKRSLRFKDYFTGSRTRPLAMVTNPNYGTDVQVNDSKVSVIDVTRSIQVQRFLNAVNAAGRKYGEYIGALFGVRPNKDMHEPIYLAHSSDKIFAAESENTGSPVYENTGGLNTTENNVTAVFRGNSSNYEYTVSVNEPCVILGVVSYDISRLYPDTINRSFFTQDRFDMFNPMMQYIGDQKVYEKELVSDAGGNSLTLPFGYQFNGMQWKQMFPRCAGAFGSSKLPGYAFVYRRNIGTNVQLSPDFLRAHNDEMDEFYLSLSSFSLGTYFHFIVRQYNHDDASRPMAAQPQIL